MRSHEFAEALRFLPAALQSRAEALHPYLRYGRCDSCQQIADAVHLALMAARYDEHDPAKQLIHTAEELASTHIREPGDCGVARWRSGQTGRHGVVNRWVDVPGDLVAATDASWKNNTHGIGYVVSNGLFGLHGWPYDRLDPTGPSRPLINELRAVELLLAGLDRANRLNRLTVLVDSVPAVSYLHRWQAGKRTMPPGYSLRARSRGGKPTLVRLAERLPHLPEVTFQHVKGHTGHLLNEAADALSRMARRRVHEQFDLRSRAKDLVNAFLRDWHSNSTDGARRRALQESSGKR